MEKLTKEEMKMNRDIQRKGLEERIWNKMDA
jgi:hypothetical protein